MGREFVSIADQLKHKLKDLYAEREAKEKELSMLAEQLPQDPGMHGALVDSEGYPRADIDIASIRAQRQRIIVLTNDQAALTDQMGQLLKELHSQASPRPSSPATSSATAGTSQPAGAASPPAAADGSQQRLDVSMTPFAIVNDVSEGSPAGQGGITPGDKIIRFGTVSASDSSHLQAIGKLVQDMEGREVAVTVLRRGAVVSTAVTPNKWSGRGLLGASLAAI